MYAKDPSLRLLVRERELDLPVDTPGTNEGGVQRLNPVRRHDNLRHKMEMTSVFYIVLQKRNKRFIK
jgi:hypothetical protein